MRIKQAKTAGFCFGVDRAVNLAYETAEKGVKACSLGPLIHNDTVTDSLREKGIRIIGTPEEAESGETVIIRAHGVAPGIYEALGAKGAQICDATCPVVKKIHNIVTAESSPDIPVLIAGNADHPEIIGIRGYCKGESFTFNSAQELENILKADPELCKKSVIAVSQTTFSLEEWEKCKKIINFLCTNKKIFDTICSATRNRQEEASLLSKECDAMVVIGGRHSSNTAKLYNLCKANCDTFLVERAEELKNIDFSTYARVGVTAGASTPAGIIKEVLFTMSEINETLNTQVEEVPSVSKSADNEFEEAMLSELNDDSIVKCRVEAINATEIQVSLPGDHRLGGLTGIVANEDYSNDPDADPAKELEIGQELTLIILKGNDSEGTVKLSKKRLDAQKSWTDLIEAKEEEKVLEGTVVEITKNKDGINSGIIVSYKGARVFIPAPLAKERQDDNLEDLLKKDVQFRIIEIDNNRRRAKGSIRAVASEKRRAANEAFWAAAEVGKTYTGIVKSMTNYGAFVDIGGVDGMVHISEMSWKRIKNPSEIFSIGQEVEVFIKALDPENKKISLGYRKDEDNPWAILKKTYEVGAVVEAEVVGITTFGAFARVIPGIDGLIHISQIANRRIEKPEEVLSVGEKVTCKITAIDYDKKRVSLSIRALLPEAEEPEDAAEEAAEEVTEAAEEAVEAPAEAAEEAVEAPAEAAAEAVEEVAEEVAEEAAEAAEEAAEAAEEAVEAPAEAAEEAVEEAAEEVAEAAEAAEEAAEAPADAE